MTRHDVDGLPIRLGDVAGLMSALDRLTGDAALRIPSAAQAVEAHGNGTGTVFEGKDRWDVGKAFCGGT